MTWKDVIHYATKGNPVPDNIIVKTDNEWSAQLTPEQYQITRLKGTEQAFTGEHCATYETGKYNCTCCNTPLFDSTIKFKSNSGWPSFTAPIKENAVKYIKDTTNGMIRVEILCNTCDAHLGHVFPDGPEPSGLRFCVNSISIQLNKDE
jgi:peptide-methionine (R)-S-oxide reductase